MRRLVLSPKHQPTGKTRHHRYGQLLPAPYEIQIVQILSDPGYYLLYLDENGEEQTDTYHGSLGEALAQAEWEFQCQEEDWQVLDQR
jgi:hypothetical protein